MSLGSLNNSASIMNMLQPKNATAVGVDRLIRKEVSLGSIREMTPPQNHIGLQIAPFLEVPSDDVIFDYLAVETDGLAPARAEDAESELARKDDATVGQGRASVIDWSIKDHYDASEVNHWRELATIVEAMRGGSLPLTISGAVNDFASKVARDQARRRRKLDNRLEWLTMSALSDGAITYDDGRIKFNVDYGRPADQKAGNAAADLAAADITDGVWNISSNTHDPIKTFNEINQLMFDRYGVHVGSVIGSRKAFNKFVNSDKFSQRAGLGAAYTGSGSAVAPDPAYLIDGWGPLAARAVVENATGIKLIEYDAVYRTRPFGSGTITSNRFVPEGRLIFLPAEADLSDIDETQVGFAKTLTSPHPEGNWSPSFYEWEKSDVDPWGQDMGSGIKAFPVFPFMELTYAVNVTM